MSNFLILNLLDIFEHFTAVHFHLKLSLIFGSSDFRVQPRLRPGRQLTCSRCYIKNTKMSLSSKRRKEISNASLKDVIMEIILIKLLESMENSSLTQFPMKTMLTNSFWWRKVWLTQRFLFCRGLRKLRQCLVPTFLHASVQHLLQINKEQPLRE